jgi:hypothetical protein
MPIEHPTKEEEVLYGILYDQCRFILGDKQELAKNEEEFESLVSMCSLNNILGKLSELYPDPSNAVIALRELIRKGWVTETRDKHDYLSFMPSTHMEIEIVTVVRNRKKNETQNLEMNSKRVLHLTLSKLPFEVMVTGEKNIEYREPSKWILSRLIAKQYDLVKFVNGYGNRPYFVAKFIGWDLETSPHVVIFSNGLRVDVREGIVKIYIGEILEKGNY